MMLKQAADFASVKENAIAIIQVLNNQYYRIVIHSDDVQMARKEWAAEKLMELLSKEVLQKDKVDEAVRLLNDDPTSQCRKKTEYAFKLWPKLMFLQREQVPRFDRRILSSTTSASTLTVVEHNKWTSFLS